ncbi:MAG: hypothetical protein AAGA92_11785 [Planctomycetota bacterium]
MQPSTAFRLVLMLSLASALVGTVFIAQRESLLPSGLIEYLAEAAPDPEAPPTTKQRAARYAGTGFLIAYLAVIAGMFFFKKWARPVGLLVTATSFIVHPLNGPIIDSGWGVLFFDLASVLWGAMLAMSYCPPCSGLFAKEPNA